MKKKTTKKEAVATKVKPNVKTVTTKSLLAIKKEATTLSGTVEDFEVKSVEDVEAATTILSNIAKAQDLIKSEKKRVTEKLKELINIENERWKASEDLLAAASAKLRGQVMDFRLTQQTAAVVAEAKVFTAMKSGKIKNETTAMKKIEAINANLIGKSVGSGSFKAVYKLKIVNENLIPRNYLVPNEALIKQALKDGVEVPGCEWVKEETLAIRK